MRGWASEWRAARRRSDGKREELWADYLPSEKNRRVRLKRKLGGGGTVLGKPERTGGWGWREKMAKDREGWACSRGGA